MKNTFKIFFSDIKSLSRHFFAVLVVIAIMIIPALYAWVNIYANSDPYGNTGNISVAVASDDLGYEGQNMGESVLEGLKDNKSINWVFTGSTDKAIKGVESGKYYAAIVIGENFSRNMYDLKSALTDNESTVTYYKNAKTNAIAVKITDTAAETVQNNVKVQYLKVLFQTVFTKGQELGEDIDEEQAVNAVIAQLTDLSKSLRHYSDSVGRFVSDSSSISYVLSGIGSSTANASAALSGSQATLNSAQAAVSNAQTSIDQLANGLDGKLAELEADLDAVTDALNKLASSEVINGSIELHNQMVDNAKNAAAKLQTHLESLRAILPENSALSGTAYVANTLDALIERTKQMQNQLDLLYNDASFVEDAANITGACADTVSLMRSMITNQLKTGIDMMLTNLSSTLNMMSPLISSLGITLDDIAPVVESAGDTLSYVSSAMTRLQSLMTRVADACDQLLVKINEGTADERLQTLITVLGDLHFIGIQCEHPVMFWFAGAMCSFVFTLFIYSLTVALGNIGEALAVVVMVVQVAGAGCTFPIETLPKVFHSLYNYLPFQFGMNAMKEAIAGLYEDDYWRYIAKLSVYILVSLFIGLVGAIPFRRLNKIIDKNKEKSGIMI